jgi:hypothetical protein
MPKTITMTAGEYSLDGIHDIDNIPAASISYLDLSCQLNSTQDNPQSTERPDVGNLRLLISRPSSRLELDNQDNILAFGVMQRIHDILKTHRLPALQCLAVYGLLFTALIAICIVGIAILHITPNIVMPVTVIPILILFFVALESMGGPIIYLSPKTPGFFAKHREQFAVKAVEIVMAAAFAAILSTMTGITGYYIGKGQGQQSVTQLPFPTKAATTPVTEPTTAPATKPTK